MQSINTIEKYRLWRKNIKGTIGFIPTMGALHKGHLSLIKNSIKICDYTVVSIFLNPKQFSVGEDLDNYPQNLKQDLKILLNLSPNIVFTPSREEIFANDFSTIVKETNISSVLEGNSRPSFFAGVTTIVLKLFNIINPTHSFFGEKDAQQLLVIKKMVKDLSYPIHIISCPTIREKSGLAMSSRNTLLSTSEKQKASIIYQSLLKAKKLLLSGERSAIIIKKLIKNTITSENVIRIDYISISELKTLLEIYDTIKTDILISIAVYINKTRLIDNISFVLGAK